MFEVNRHFKLLVVTTLDEPLGSDKGKDDHLAVLLVIVSISMGWDHLGGRTDKLTHINSHRVKFVYQDLVYFQLGLQLVETLGITREAISF